ncbi:ABC transporter substrate-binding protein [Halosimplex aquaticum]|uniref:ABC transporter substrate-binding protein n=1 Tax=Halosimplex aquaticum TaxID=3026162 RepID=A0ABD5XX36_9EURY|nr:ABC transporter substrate-binding protein [Halosimplex aquaticum]
MVRDSGADGGPTRRDCVKYGGTLVGGGLLAGCLDGEADGSPEGDDTGSTSTRAETGSPTASGTSASEPDRSETATATGGHSAEMAPVGTVEFESVPESFVGGWGFEADVMTALGESDKLVAAEGNQFWYTGFYDQLPGVSVPEPDSVELVRTDDWSLREEFLYELDPDLLATDPNRYVSYYGVGEEEIAELHDSVAPFFGNSSRRKRGDGWPTWPGGESYAYYSVPEFLSRYGDVFRKSAQATAFNEFYRTALSAMRSKVPPRDDRPEVALLNAQINPETQGFFRAYNPRTALDQTYGKKQYRDLGVVDAFAGQYGGQPGIKVDYEALLDVDPDAIVFHFGLNYRDWNGENALRKRVEGMRDSSLGTQLSAVQDDELYVGGSAYQGPIINLFQTEMLGKQLYPEAFGEWPGAVTDADLPEIPPGERLIDRERMAAIVSGAF